MSRPWSLALLPLVLGACSTALLVDTPYDDDSQPEAGVIFDASTPRDGSVPRDATTPRDSGAVVMEAGRPDAATPRDAGPSDPNFPRNCATDIPADNFSSLLTDDCARRPLAMCVNQAQLDMRLQSLVQACRVPGNATIGVHISAAGCPEWLTYVPRVTETVSLCLQTVLESVRFNCPNRCALVSGRR